MKKYFTPTVQFISFEVADVIRTSTHDEMAIYDTLIDWNIRNGEFM
jgi:hypothetical protein